MRSTSRLIFADVLQWVQLVCDAPSFFTADEIWKGKSEERCAVVGQDGSD